MEKRFKAVCIDDGGSINLEVGDECFTTNLSKPYVYCFRSDTNKNSHFAMLPSRLFKQLEEVIHRETDTGQLAFF
jgi:hypothetical protein